MTLRLTVLAGDLKGQAFLLDGEAVTIGRGPGVDLEIKDPSISKQHARVEVVQDQIRVLDLGSRNGIRAGGKAVNKVKFKQGSVTIGRIPVRIEFESDVNQVPVATETPKASDSSNPDYGDSGPTNPNDANKAMQVVSLVSLIAALVAILVYGFRDIIWAEQPPQTIMVKVKVDADSHRISLPANYAGDANTQKSTEHFDIEVAAGTKRALIITPLMIGSTSVPVRLVDGTRIIYEIHVIEGDEIIDTIGPKIRLTAEERKKLAANLTIRYQQLKKIASQTDLENSIAALIECNEILSECREHRIKFDEIGDARRLKGRLDGRLDEERERLFLDAMNDVTLYNSSHMKSDLRNALKKMERVFTFTDGAFIEFDRYQNFQDKLMEMKRTHRGP